MQIIFIEFYIKREETEVILTIVYKMPSLITNSQATSKSDLKTGTVRQV